jgi:hypothetical protein
LVGARVERSGGADGTPNLARRDKLSNGHGLDLLRRVLLEGLHRSLFGYGNKLRSGLTVRDGMVLSLNASSESDFKGVADTNELRDYERKDEPDEDEERKSRGEGCRERGATSSNLYRSGLAWTAWTAALRVARRATRRTSSPPPSWRAPRHHQQCHSIARGVGPGRAAADSCCVHSVKTPFENA